MPVSAVAPFPSVSPYPNYNRDEASVFPKKEDNVPPSKKDDSTGPKGTGKKQLTPEQEKDVEKLKKVDAKVKAHEQAHVAAGGAYIKGGVNYSYQKGPDGVMYAVGGEVSIDTSPVRNNPQATIAKMEAVKAAALAPADPSGQDRAVASAAAQAEAKAQQEISASKTGKGEGGKASVAPGTASSSNAASVTTLIYSASGQKTANVKPAQQMVNMVV
jgi:hypothetical protein